MVSNEEHVPIVLVAMGFNTCPDGLWSYFGPINSFLYSHFFFLEWECGIVGGSVDKVFAMRVGGLEFVTQEAET